MRPLFDDRLHADECHKRWLRKANRDLSQWDRQQCGCCIFYIRLVAEFNSDWGVCSNAASPFDGRVMFEHDGCDQHVLADDWVH